MQKKFQKTKHNLIHILLNILSYMLKALISTVIWITVGVAGIIIFQSKQSPFDMVFGIPLALIGIGLTLNGILSFILSIFSAKFNQGICRWCSK